MLQKSSALIVIGLLLACAACGQDAGDAALHEYDPSLFEPGDGTRVPGQVVARYRVPSEFAALNGLAWDGEQLWGVDYRKVGTASALRMDVRATQPGDLLIVTEAREFALPKMEGAAHDLGSKLFVGARTDGSRSSAAILEFDLRSASLEPVRRLATPDALWPNYHDADGLALAGDRLLSVINADHALSGSQATVHILDMDGKLLRHFWLPDETANDVAYAHGFLIYKPIDAPLIRIIRVASSVHDQQADVAGSVPIVGDEVTDHWGATHDGAEFLYLSQDTEGGAFLWQIYFPLRKPASTP